MRLLARLVRVLLAREYFETVADLTEALKCECARLHIRWTPDDINAAYRLIESNRPLPGAPMRRPVCHVERVDEHRTLSRDEASALWSRLCVALIREQSKAGARG